MPSWTALPYELKLTIMAHVLSDVFTQVLQEPLYEVHCAFTVSYITASDLMPSARQEIDALLSLWPDMSSELLTHFHEKGREWQEKGQILKEARWYEYVDPDEYNVARGKFFRASDVAFRLAWHVWAKDSEYVQGKVAVATKRRREREEKAEKRKRERSEAAKEATRRRREKNGGLARRRRKWRRAY